MTGFQSEDLAVGDIDGDSNALLELYRIAGIPPSMYYIPNFISVEEEQSILSKIPPNKWISLSKRRLQAIPAQLTANSTLVSSSGLPGWLTQPISARLAALEVFKDAPHGVNHCLINEYEPGQGIMAHEDGAAYHPVVATVSLGGTLVLDVGGKKLIANTAGPDPRMSEDRLTRWRVLQEPRSLLITSGTAYTDTLHGIEQVDEDVGLGPETVANWGLLGDVARFEATGGKNVRTTRISLTFRDVKKVSSIGSRVFGKTKP